MSESIPTQSTLNEDNTNTPLETKTFLKLVVSNPHPNKKIPFNQAKEPNGATLSSFNSEVHVKGPYLYEMILSHSSHYLACSLILEVEESRNRDEGKKVICHFPTLAGEGLSDFVDSNETLYSAFIVKQRAILTPLGGKTASKIDPPAM
jgi:hypothetical protein